MIDNYHQKTVNITDIADKLYKLKHDFRTINIRTNMYIKRQMNEH